jgi:hypothetical protein
LSAKACNSCASLDRSPSNCSSSLNRSNRSSYSSMQSGRS